ncbi:MAG: hypothetical protein E6G33_15335 [Actinobacteria bacterium]|nr:MAG: hypothetical protein E6G33_15335 [Actinomycetota bacterium]
MRELLRSPLARVWVPVLTLAAGVAFVDRGSDPGDLVYFIHRGEHLLSSGWASTFADPMLQSGPLQLVVFGAVRNLTALAFVVELSVAALVLYVAGRIRASDRVRLVVGLLAVGAGLTHIAFVDGHPAEAIVPLLWVLAAIWAREDRVVLAGAVLGLSAGLELWGVLGVPVLLLAPRPRRALAGALVETAVVAGMFAPFALAGSAHMFQYDWRVSSGTLLSLFVAPGAHFGWPLRLLQSALAVTAGGSVALALRRSVHAAWLAPLAVTLVRLLVDPLSFGWYWLEVEALVLIGAALLLTDLPTRLSTAVARTARV